MKWTAVVVLKGPEGAYDDFYSCSIGMLPPTTRQHPLGTRDFVFAMKRQWGIEYQMLGPVVAPEPKPHWLRRFGRGLLDFFVEVRWWALGF